MENYYVLPLKIDKYCAEYIWANINIPNNYLNQIMAFNYLDDDKIFDNDLLELTDIIECINGNKPGVYDANINPNNSEVIQINGKDILLIRGWSTLISESGYNLSYDKAMQAQDEFIKFTINQLRRDLKK